VASGAADLEEQFEPFDLLGGQGAVVALEEIIEPISCDQGPLKRGDGLSDVVVRDGRVGSRECLGEQGGIVLVLGEPIDDHGLGGRRLDQRDVALQLAEEGAQVAVNDFFAERA